MGLKLPPKDGKKFERPMQQDYKTSFLNFLQDNGVEVDAKEGLIVGQIRHAFMNVNGVRKNVAWYVFYLDQSVPFGMTGDYRISQSDPTAVWRPENQQHHALTPEQKQEIEQLARQAEIDRAIALEDGAEKAKTLWEAASDCEVHPYLEKKNVLSYGLRQNSQGTLYIPMYDDKLEVVGIERIYKDGSKKTTKGSNKSGSFFILGREILKHSDKITYAEGYATAASYYADHSTPVIVCFSANNLIKVAETMWGHFKKKKHVFLADNDEDSQTGEREARKAAEFIRSKGGEWEIVMPELAGDYNDHEVEALEGEVIVATKNLDLPMEYDWVQNSKGRYINNKENVNGVLLTQNIQVRYNVIKKMMEYDIPDTNFISDMRDESALIEIENRCINLGIPHTKVRDYLKLLAEPYNPVKEWIDSRAWDGRSRLQEFLDTIQTNGSNKLKEILMKKWLISCVAAAFEPNGVELEGILLFQGAQGLGKTLWFKRLCDYESGWLLEGAMLNPSDKDSVKRAVSHWIVELGEVESTFKKADLDQLKAFITSKTDEFRLPYDRANTRYQRRTAFYASVNAREFLIDSSGNRRFWVIPVTSIDFTHRIDMQQLWAEIRTTLYSEGQKNWFLSPDERELLQESNETYRTQSSVEDLILERVNFNSYNTEPVQMTQLLRDLGIKAPRIPDFKDAARVLSEYGIEPRRSNGKKVYDLDYKPLEKDAEDYTRSGKDWDY